MAFIPGVERLGETAYSDTRRAGKSRDAALEHQPELQWYMEKYSEWRDLYDGRALEETVSITKDAADDEKALRWPVQFNLVSAYCQLHAGMLWGRGKTGRESNDLFRVRVDPRIPYGSKPATNMADELEELFNYFWAKQIHVLRANSVIQQWAGGCIIKVAWNPASRHATFGITLETIQPEHFFPIWNPLSFEELYAAKIKFSVSRAVAIARYNVSEKDLQKFGRDPIPVEEYWDAAEYYIKVGKKDGEDDSGVVAKGMDGKPLEGENPWKHPVTKMGIIPIHYIPRVRAGKFLGESLAYRLSGLQSELNKTLADYGDALNRGAHPSFGISDYNAKESVIPIPRHGALNMGKTRAGGTPAKVHKFPDPSVPAQASEFLDRLLSLSEAQAGLTPAARGLNVGRDSGLALSMQMLPTINLVDWQRAHLSQSIAGSGGINDSLLTILYHKQSLTDMPAIKDSPTLFRLPQTIDFMPVVPRDRMEIINEVVQLATAEVVSPMELLERLGDIEDIDEELEDLKAYLQFKAQMEAAVAGRAIKVTASKETENPARAWPEISGETVEPAPKQPAKQSEGMKPKTGK